MRYWILLLLLAGCAQSLPGEDTCTSTGCHATLLQKKNVHAAAESCDSCHEPLVGSHPQKGRKTFRTVQELPALCATCHEAFGQKKNLHSPVKEGLCTSCHDPHSSAEPKLLTEPIQDLCKGCHSEVTEFKNLHGPTAGGDCLVCHAPHESDNTTLLIQGIPESCMQCHPEMQDTLKKPYVHPPATHMCTSCHNPHGAESNSFLTSTGKELCLECHSDVSEKLKTDPILHGAITSEKACASCHSPHASDYRTLLLQPADRLCLQCHSSVIPQNAALLHGPIRQGTCNPCHNPHSSPFPKLLSKSFPTQRYVAYSEKEYELCFSCHNRDLLAYPDTRFATQFRDGEQNLHFLHVNKKEKGRSCTLCHTVHAANNPGLVAESVQYGQWKLNLKYQKTAHGGSCAPGCHRPQTYNRD